jgi:hypothetical protein
MLITLKRRVTKLELLKKTVGPKSFDDLVTEVEDYARRTGVSLDDAIVRFLNDVSNDDLNRFIAETESATI